MLSHKLHVSRFTFHILHFTFCVLALLLLASSALGQGRPVTDDEVNDVAKDVYCPVCESTPLDACPTQACADWREYIRIQLSEGKTKEEIHAYFASRYGDAVLSAPPRRGFSLLLWGFPIALLIFGGVFFGRYLYHLRGAPDKNGHVAAVPGETTAPGPADVPEDYVARVEQELAQK